MSENNDTRLALQALNHAKSARGRSDDLLHHSDRASPSGNDLYTDRLCALRKRPSMSDSGECGDNAVEKFFSTLESELLRNHSFTTHSQAQRIVSEQSMSTKCRESHSRPSRVRQVFRTATTCP